MTFAKTWAASKDRDRKRVPLYARSGRKAACLKMYLFTEYGLARC